MAEENQFHLSLEAAENYERQKMPAIFAPMAEATLDAISLPDRADVLDVACGTGAVARAVAKRLREPGRIVGTDLNPAMIEIARRKTPECAHELTWVAASAESLPFADASFDLAFCQQGLQFFPDKPAALREIRRVMRKGGDLIVTCWAGVPPFFKVVANVLGRHIDAAAAAKAVAPFVWNDGDLIKGLIANAGFECPVPGPLPVMRIMSASPHTMREELLATPNEPAIRAAGEAVMDTVIAEILEGVSHYRSGENLAMPQQALLFRATAA